MTKFWIVLLMPWLLIACSSQNEETAKNTEMKAENHQKGTFGYDYNFLKNKQDIIMLKSEDAAVLVSTAYQGRVMTSTAAGMSGKSFGWINYLCMESKELSEHFNPFGGEDRLWLGPEGGQFSIYFKENAPFNLDNWYVPKEIDTEPFDVIEQNDTTVLFKKKMNLINYSGFSFEFEIDRRINLLNNNSITSLLGVDIPKELKAVGFESVNKITNTGNAKWEKSTGTLSLWILGMLTPSPSTTIIIPFIPGDEEKLGKIVTDDYFGKVPADRLIVKDSIMFFKGDGKLRSKIGVSPQRAKPFSGSYDAENKVLTIVNYTLHEGVSDYVNSLWEIQDKPYSGDAVNSFNDEVADDEPKEPFYELESSSPAADLKPGGEMMHTHKTFHFQGSEDQLNTISTALLGVDIQSIKSIFN